MPPVVVLGVMWVGRAADAADGVGSTPEPVRFSRDIRPLLADRCFTCHGPERDSQDNSLRLDDRARAIRRRAIVPGKPDRSELIERVTSGDPDERMPPPGARRKPLRPSEIELLRRWIDDGANYDEHWSYVPPRLSPIPACEDRDWAENPVDRFLRAEQQRRGVRPSPLSDRRTLARRLFFDLTGLPPRPDDVDEFVEDRSDSAYPLLVDRLLASPHYGERMAMWWLDLVRYADSAGYHSDPPIPMSPYRDYVIAAFNRNLPFDQFTVEQLAGDLLEGATVEQRIASGYNRLNKTTDEGGAQPREYVAKYAADRVRTTASTWLGATLGCAECHDHKFDPYTMRDFYGFAAFFADLEEQGKYAGNPRPPILELPTPDEAARASELEERIAELKRRAENAADEAERKSLEDEGKQLAKDLKVLRDGFRRTLISVAVKPREVRVLPRGNWMDTSGEVVEPAIPEFLGALEVGDRRATRLDLARWLVSRENPLTARVIVNRLWKMFFGNGISARLDDLGFQGEWPVHPELLDWLAVELIESGWDVKHIVRLMVTSRAYRQSSAARRDLDRIDPSNRLVARQAAFRLDAELVRDAALAVSGLLTREIGGPSVKPYQPKGYWQHLNFPRRTYQADTGKDQYRRGLYTHWQRTFLHPSLLAFDAPTREECTADRARSNTPLAALVLLNDPTYVEAARVFAERILREESGMPRERAAWALRQALSRPAKPEEREILVRLFSSHLEHYRAHPNAAREVLSTGLAPIPGDIDPVELAAWTSVARAVFNLHEVITRS